MNRLKTTLTKKSSAPIINLRWKITNGTARSLIDEELEFAAQVLEQKRYKRVAERAAKEKR